MPVDDLRFKPCRNSRRRLTVASIHPKHWCSPLSISSSCSFCTAQVSASALSLLDPFAFASPQPPNPPKSETGLQLPPCPTALTPARPLRSVTVCSSTQTRSRFASAVIRNFYRTPPSPIVLFVVVIVADHQHHPPPLVPAFSTSSGIVFFNLSSNLDTRAPRITHTATFLDTPTPTFFIKRRIVDPSRPVALQLHLARRCAPGRREKESSSNNNTT